MGIREGSPSDQERSKVFNVGDYYNSIYAQHRKGMS